MALIETNRRNAERQGAVPLPPDVFELSDADVVERVRAGETGLFEVLMRRYNRRLYRVTWSILLDGAEAEDVVQDAYVRAFQHLDQFAGRAPFATWLTRIAAHEASARRRKRRRLVALDGLEGVERERLISREADGAGGPPGAEDRLLARSARELLRRAVARLPPGEREVFVLREVEGLSNRETAVALGLTRTASKVRLFRARRRLRRELARITGGAVEHLLPFAGERCRRTVERVLERIADD